MHLLGKILLVVNALAAAGLVYTATQDWARRQEITSVALRHHLALKGLPVDAPAGTEEAIPLNVETTGGYVVESVGPKLIALYFTGAEGGQEFGATGKPVSTQLQELKRVEEKIDATLRATDDAGRLARVAGRMGQNFAFEPGWLMAMAETYEERELLRRLAGTVTDGAPAAIKEAADTAERMLKNRVAAALAKPDPRAAAVHAERVEATLAKLRATPADADAQKELADVLAGPAPAATQDEGERKRELAHILMHLDRSAAWQKRVALVVGLRVLQNAVADQATRMQDMARSAQRQLELDQGSFLDLYKQLEVLAAERALLLEQQSQIRKELEGRSAADATAATQRKRQLDDRAVELDRLRADVAQRLDEQATAEAAIFADQKAAALTLQRAFDLEEQLKAAEQAKR